MKKHGFTLAEVLITMALLGVVAALTLPSLHLNIAREQVGPKLAKAINTLENANRLILQDRNVRSLQSACDLSQDNASSEYLECLGNYVAGSFQEDETTSVLTLKDGITYRTQPTRSLTNTGRANGLSRKYSGQGVFIDIDINGNTTPNEYSRDRFMVIIDTYGAVIAMGSLEYADYTGHENFLWTNSCNRTSQPTKSPFCTGSIVDNGYKVIYKYH